MHGGPLGPRRIQLDMRKLTVGFRTSRLIGVCYLLAGLALSAGRGQEIKLWPNGAPGSEGITAEEASKPAVNLKYDGLPGNFTVTHYPSIYVFLPPAEIATGAAVVVAP